MDDEPFDRPKVPDGHIGVTVSVRGLDAFTMAIDVAAVGDVLAFIDRASGFGQGGRQNPAVHEKIRRATEHMLRHPPGDAGMRQTAAMAVLWCALNHPSQGGRLRAELSEDLRVHGTAHLVALADARHTWRYVPVQNAAEIPPCASAMLAADPSPQQRKEPKGWAMIGVQ